MGAEPWLYWVPYQQSIDQALKDLREQVFRSGRYRGNELRPATPEEALRKMEADGTASILDITRVTELVGYCAVAPLSRDELIEHFGTETPTRRDVSGNMDFMEQIERGQGRYIIAYLNGKPSEILFCGYSFD